MITLYDELCSMKNLSLAYRKARKGKSKKWYVKEFDLNPEENLSQLQKELSEMTYIPQPMKTFVIRDPKTRVISVSAFRDRIVHHALCNIIEPLFERSFIFDSYANRKGKGTHAALKRFDYFKRKVSSNGKLTENAKDNNMVVGYFLKADIRHYFDSVDHEILIQLIERKVRDERVIYLTKKILDNHTRKGMPIGNLTSQFFANVYLHELDHFVKHRLKTRYYIRYVDDFVILNRNKEILEKWKIQIGEFLNSVRLELQPQKSKIYPLHRGVNLLGYRIFYHYRLPYKRNLRRFNKILEEGNAKSIEGWLAYAEHANTYKLRKTIEAKLLQSL